MMMGIWLWTLLSILVVASLLFAAHSIGFTKGYGACGNDVMTQLAEQENTP